MKRVLVGMLFSLVVAAVPAAQMKYGVTAKADKNVDFTKFKSYSWSVGQPNPTKSIDALIVAAVDRELKALGLSKAEPGPGDVLVSYYAFRRTDVGAKPKSDTGVPAQTAVGTLSVVCSTRRARRRCCRCVWTSRSIRIRRRPKRSSTRRSPNSSKSTPPEKTRAPREGLISTLDQNGDVRLDKGSEVQAYKSSQVRLEKDREYKTTLKCGWTRRGQRVLSVSAGTSATAPVLHR